MRKTVLFCVSVLILSNFAFADDQSAGFVHIDVPAAIESSCVIPDHNGGKWGCKEITVPLFHTADYASEIVIINHTAPGAPSISVRDLWTYDKTSITLIDGRDTDHLGLPMIDGKNDIEFALYEYGTLISSEFMTLNFLQLKDF